MEEYRLEDFDDFKINKIAKKQKRPRKEYYFKDKIEKVHKTLEGGKKKIVYFKFCGYCGQRMRGEKSILESHFDG